MSLFSLPLIGCSAKLPFCKSNPCQNGGTCSVSWETFSCDCPLGFGGKDCSHGEMSLMFSGATCCIYKHLYITVTLIVIAWFYYHKQVSVCLMPVVLLLPISQNLDSDSFLGYTEDAACSLLPSSFLCQKALSNCAIEQHVKLANEICLCKAKQVSAILVFMYKN